MKDSASRRAAAGPEAELDEAILSASTPADVGEIKQWASARRHVELTLYGAVTLLALILGLRIEEVIDTPKALVGAMWASSVGLAIAHWFASSIASRVSSPVPLPLGHYSRALVQSYPLLIASAFGTFGAIIGVWAGDGVKAAAQGADFMLIMLCGAVAWGGATAHEAPIRRRVVLSLSVIIFASLIAGVKFILGH